MLIVNKQVLAGYTMADLFAGMGGFRLALESLGAKCVFSSENNPSVASTYCRNFRDHPGKDISYVRLNEIPDFDILCAGFPCQPFSIAGRQLGFEDCRGNLFFEIMRIVNHKKPKVLFLENVKNLVYHDLGNTFDFMLKLLKEQNYSVNWKVINANTMGIPQTRERVYIVAIRNDVQLVKKFEFPKPVRLQRFIEDFLLPENEIPPDYYATNFRVIENENYSTETIRLGELTTEKGYPLISQGCRIYSIRGSAPTITSQGGSFFAKTEGILVNGRARKFHQRESARLMGYPDSYKLPQSRGIACTQIGNSVVIDVIQRIGAELGLSLGENIFSNEEVIDKNEKEE